MNRVHEALGLTRAPGSISERGGEVVTPDTAREIEKAARSLARLSQAVPVRKPPPESQLVHVATEFLARFADGARPTGDFFDPLRRVRSLAAALWTPTVRGHTIVERAQAVQAALSIIDGRYRDGMLPHLFYAMLRVWGTHRESAEHLRRYIARKCESYDGRRRFHLALRGQGKPFLASAAPTVLAKRLLARGEALMAPLEWAPLPDGAVKFGFFGEVAMALVATSPDSAAHERLNEVLAFISSHGDTTVAKKVVAEFVTRLQGRLSPSDKDVIQKAALSTIGDPALSSVSWEPWPEASARERADLAEARRVVNSWMSEHLSELFFSKVAIDRDRRAFWKPYVGQFLNLKIYANPSTLRRLRADASLQDALKTRVGRLERDSRQNALVMETKSHVLVEFSHSGGPFCAHLRSNEGCPDTRGDRAFLNRLKNGPRRYADEAPYATHGRFYHQGDWPTRFRAFLRYNGLIS